MLWFFFSHASKLKITYSLCILLIGFGTIDHCISATARHSQAQPCSWWLYACSSCWIIQPRFSIDPLKTNFPWMFNNSMQQRCSIVPPRFSVLQCLHLHLRRYKLVLHVRLEIISISKRKHSYQFASGIKPSSLSARVFAGNQSGSSLSYSVAA